jgi:tetratricopeptide (TPR) repeat protein
MNTSQHGDEIERGERLYHNGNIEEALAVFESILKAEPYNVLALNNKGLILNSLGKNQEAIQTFWEVIRKEKSNAD